MEFSISLSNAPSIVNAHFSKRSAAKQSLTYNVPHWGLDFCHSGGAVNFLDRNESLTYTPGCIMITSPHQRIRVVERDPRDALYFCFDVQELNSDYVKLPAVIDVGEKFTWLHEIAIDALRAWPVQPVRTSALLWTILWEIAQYHDLRVPESQVLRPAIRTVMEIIALELGQKLTLSELSKRVNLAPSTLSRLFHSQTGLTLISYIRKKRIEQAKFLVSQTDMPIKEIAHRVGLPDLHTFSKTFSREMGQCPRDYRENLQAHAPK